MLEEQSRIYTSLNKLVEKERELKKEVDKKEFIFMFSLLGFFLCAIVSLSFLMTYPLIYGIFNLIVIYVISMLSPSEKKQELIDIRRTIQSYKHKQESYGFIENNIDEYYEEYLELKTNGQDKSLSPEIISYLNRLKFDSKEYIKEIEQKHVKMQKMTESRKEIVPVAKSEILSLFVVTIFISGIALFLAYLFKDSHSFTFDIFLIAYYFIFIGSIQFISKIVEAFIGVKVKKIKIDKKIKAIHKEIPDFKKYSVFYIEEINKMTDQEIDDLDSNFINEIVKSQKRNNSDRVKEILGVNENEEEIELEMF